MPSIAWSFPSRRDRRWPRALLGGLALIAAGEARAQCMMARLEAAQVVPPSAATGAGLAFVQIDTENNTLSYDLSFVGFQLVETATHIHGYAGPGANAPIVHTLPRGDNKTGAWIYPEADEDSLLAGLAYLDVHTVAYPGGHLRGQILPDSSDALLYGRMDGNQVVPPVGGAQTGIVILRVDTDLDVAMTDYFIYPVVQTFYSALEGYAPPGQNGAFLAGLFNGLTSPWDYPPGDEDQILAGLVYAQNYAPSGPAARAQLVPMCTRGPVATNYCTAGTSSVGCQAAMAGSGVPSTNASAGFRLEAASVPGLRNGIFFFGTNGKQANPWGNGTSFQCVVPPVSRVGQLMIGHGTAGLCDGTFARDLNAHWCPTCPKAVQNPGAGAIVDAQLWYRDPENTSNQTTSLSDAIEFMVGY